MARKCGFTPGFLLKQLQEKPFAEVVIGRRPNFELMAIACKRARADAAERAASLAAIEL